MSIPSDFHILFERMINDGVVDNQILDKKYSYIKSISRD
jgi:hypothetical protein